MLIFRHGARNLYSPLTPNLGLHSLHSTPSNSTFPPGSGIPSLHPHPLNPAPQAASAIHQAAMFAPPLMGLPATPIQGPLGGPSSAHLPPDTLSSSKLSTLFSTIFLYSEIPLNLRTSHNVCLERIAVKSLSTSRQATMSV